MKVKDIGLIVQFICIVERFAHCDAVNTVNALDALDETHKPPWTFPLHLSFSPFLSITPLRCGTRYLFDPALGF
jgi:hypothetical protein